MVDPNGICSSAQAVKMIIICDCTNKWTSLHKSHRECQGGSSISKHRKTCRITGSGVKILELLHCCFVSFKARNSISLSLFCNNKLFPMVPSLSQLGVLICSVHLPLFEEIWRSQHLRRMLRILEV